MKRRSPCVGLIDGVLKSDVTLRLCLMRPSEHRLFQATDIRLNPAFTGTDQRTQRPWRSLRHKSLTVQFVFWTNAHLEAKSSPGSVNGHPHSEDCGLHKLCGVLSCTFSPANTTLPCEDGVNTLQGLDSV